MASGGGLSVAFARRHACYTAAERAPEREQCEIANPCLRLFESLLRAPDLRAVPELIAVMINLATEPAVSEVRMLHARCTRVRFKWLQQATNWLHLSK